MTPNEIVAALHAERDALLALAAAADALGTYQGDVDAMCYRARAATLETVIGGR